MTNNEHPDQIKQLLEVCSQAEAAELKVLHNAQIACLRAYQNDPTSQRKKDWDAAKTGLNDMVKSLYEKYIAQSEPGDSGAVFENIYKVVEHLDAAGFRISKSKIYRDRDTGKIRVNPDGTVSESWVRAYASEYLERKEGDLGDMSDIHAKKTAREVEKLEEQIAKAKFERELQEGKYIPKKDFEAELAARVMVLETGIKHGYNMRVREWIALVGGSAGKSAELLQKMNEGLDKQLTDYANTDRFQVLFAEEDAS